MAPRAMTNLEAEYSRLKTREEKERFLRNHDNYARNHPNQTTNILGADYLNRIGGSSGSTQEDNTTAPPPPGGSGDIVEEMPPPPGGTPGAGNSENTGGGTPPPPGGETGENSEDTGGDTEDPSVLDPESKQKIDDLLAAGGAYGDSLVSKYITPEMFGTINAATTPEMEAYLKRLNENAVAAGQYTGLEQEAIDRQRESLAGYASPEVQAMREAAMQELDRELKTQMALQRINASRNRVSGAASTAQMQDLQMGRMETQGNIERDLIIKNADEVQRRKEAFSELIRKTEDARFGRQTQAESLYGASLGMEEAARTGREQFNIAQTDARGAASAALGMQGTGIYTGLYSGEEAASAQEAFLDWYKQHEENLAKMTNRQTNRYYDIVEKNINATTSQW